MLISSQQKLDFQKFIWDFYQASKRTLPWRYDEDPYKIMVSELMLQQTQVDRVIPKYVQFLSKFPTIDSLASNSPATVIAQWQGLGYNRRALYLQKACQKIMNDYHGKIPNNPSELETLPGIGKATAGAIVVYGFNQPAPFIETNIRRTFIHYFFQDQENISDTNIMVLVELTLNKQNPRDWFYALTDYGASLGKHRNNPNRKSKHYTKQSKFTGSKRQVRGAIIRLLVKERKLSVLQLELEIKDTSYNVLEIINTLEKEGFLNNNRGMISLESTNTNLDKK